MTFVIKLVGETTDTTLPVLKRDGLLVDDNDGVRFLWDAGFPFSYAGGVPINGVAIGDVAEHGDGTFVLGAGETVGFAGNGFDLSAMTSVVASVEAQVKGPASVWADIQADQEFLICSYMRLPIEADWNVAASLLPFFASSTGASSGYVTVPDPITMSFRATAKSFSFRRQTAINAMTELTMAAAGHYGLFAQVAYWRTAAGIGASVKSSFGITSATAAVGADNAADCSGCNPRFGSVYPFTAYSLAEHRASRKYKIHRGFIENLARSGRNPSDVLDADWIRTIARGTFS